MAGWLADWLNHFSHTFHMPGYFRNFTLSKFWNFNCWNFWRKQNVRQNLKHKMPKHIWHYAILPLRKLGKTKIIWWFTKRTVPFCSHKTNCTGCNQCHSKKSKFTVICSGVPWYWVMLDEYNRLQLSRNSRYQCWFCVFYFRGIISNALVSKVSYIPRFSFPKSSESQRHCSTLSHEFCEKRAAPARILYSFLVCSYY